MCKMGRPNFGDPFNIPSSSLPPTFRLPAGIGRIIAVDPTNTLLVYGTSQGVEKLREIVESLDRLAPVFELSYTLFWLDSSAPETARWRDSKQSLVVGTNADEAELERLVGAGHALHAPSPPLSVTREPLPSYLFLSPPPGPVMPNPGQTWQFESPLPRGANPGIDPDFQQPRSFVKPPARLGPHTDIDPDFRRSPAVVPPMPNPYTRPDQLPAPLVVPRAPFLLPRSSGEAALTGFRISNPAQPGGSIWLSPPEGKTLILSATALGLQPPSPRFDVPVLCVTVHRVPVPNAPGAPPVTP